MIEAPSQEPQLPYLTGLIDQEEMINEKSEPPSEESSSLTLTKLIELERMNGIIVDEKGIFAARCLMRRIIAYSGHCWWENPENPQDNEEDLSDMPEFARPLAMESRAGCTFPVNIPKEMLN